MRSSSYTDGPAVRATSIKQVRPTPESIWNTGITEHPGGLKATESLLKMTGASPGQRVIEIGCGTGYTACQLAGRGMEAIAVDINARVLERARARASKSGVADKVSFVLADAHHLPFKEGTFDLALAESVLVFCDADRVSREIYQVLRPGGVIGDNELTFLRPPDPALKAMLRVALSISALQEQEWKTVYRKAGFENVVSRTSKIRLPGQFFSHLKIDGPATYLSAVVKGIGHLVSMRRLVSPGTLAAVLKYKSYVGYGLYVGRKP